jgi:polysaccharide biosynthesis protein PslH
MRVLWLSHFVPFPATGHGALQRSHNLLREVGARHEVHLVALNRVKLIGGESALEEAREGLAPIVTSLSVLPHEGDASRWSRIRCAARSVLHGTSYVEQWLKSPACSAEVARQIEEFSPDVIHVDGIGLITFVEERRWPRVVLNHHNVESQLMKRRAVHQGNGPLAWFFGREGDRIRRLEQYAAPRVPMNLVVSTLDGERLAEVAPGARQCVVENGVDTDYFLRPAGLTAVPGAIAFAGGMDWYPNRHAVDWLCGEIWPALVADGSDWALTVIGRSPSPQLLALAARDTRVSAPGFVDDVRPMLAAARIYVCPITDGGGTRLKILDALSLERALVSTSLGVEGLGLEEGKHYLAAETPEEFVRQCRRLRDDAGLAARLGWAGREHVVRHFSWHTIGEHLERAYRSVAQASDRGTSA